MEMLGALLFSAGTLLLIPVVIAHMHNSNSNFIGLLVVAIVLLVIGGLLML